MMNKPPRSVAAARWSLADVILIDEAADLLQRTPSRGHVIVDEAQDLSPMMLRAVGRRASTGSVTVLGDLAQATTPWATRSWRESLAHLGHPNAAITELVAGFRVPGAVIDFAARLLPQIAPALKPPHSVRRHRGELDVRPTTRIGDELIEAITQTMLNEGTVGVIVADSAVSGVRKLLERQQMDYDLLGEDPQIFDTRAELPSTGPDHSASQADLGSGIASQGPGVRSRGVAGTGRDRSGRTGSGDGTPPAVRLPHPSRHIPGRGARGRAAGGSGSLSRVAFQPRPASPSGKRSSTT